MGLKDYLSLSGISHLTSPPHTPEHNGYSERRHRHIVEIGLALLSHASLPVTFWSYAFATAVYLINRMPTTTLNLSSPYELIFHKMPNYTKLKIFGFYVILGFVHIHLTNLIQGLNLVFLLDTHYLKVPTCVLNHLLLKYLFLVMLSL